MLAGATCENVWRALSRRDACGARMRQLAKGDNERADGWRSGQGAGAPRPSDRAQTRLRHGAPWVRPEEGLWSRRGHLDFVSRFGWSEVRVHRYRRGEETMG